MMNSRREEERNEKIIRGLMKLPPNRRCINCNSLGPQYVCTNFWTFVCITCSGIHREFTHRVKSVSMAKFTSQEVEALQKGGNQRARETYLKDWDLQRQRLPDNSNIERVRDFIIKVYVNKQYAGGKVSDKPPRDMQALRSHEDETRRASSYHSYSQSPPYENQYEERKYGKQLGVLSRKPGSDRGYYEGKITSFPYSPGRLAEQMYEDRFANEGSVSRVSDYSVSSSGDPFRSDNPSPNFQGKRNSPPMHRLKDELVEVTHSRTVGSSDPNLKRASSGMHTQKTASSSSFDSFDSNSVNSASVTDVVSEPERYAGTQLDGRVSASPVQKLPVLVNAVEFDPFSLQLPQQPGGFSAPSIDMFEKPANTAAQMQDLFKTADLTSTPALDLFPDTTHQNLATFTSEQKPPAVCFPQNEGWATFDLPQHNTSTFETKIVPHASIPTSDQFSFMNSSTQLPPNSYESHGTFSSVESQWHGGGHNIHHFGVPTSTKGGLSSIPTEKTSTNPFDLPYDSEETSSGLLNMSSLQAALPDSQFPPYVEDFNQSWFPPNSVAPYIPVTPQGGLACMTAEAPSGQFPNIPPQSSVASLSGNPFA